MDEQAIALALKEGEQIDLDGSVTGGINNAIGQVDTSPGAGFYQLLNTLPMNKQMAESAASVYEANFGAPQQPNQLVGTLQLQLQQAGVAQQPFYAAIADLFRQAHQLNAQWGKQHYSKFPSMLRRMVGDQAAEAIMLSANEPLEYLRAKVDLVPDTMQLRAATDREIIPGLMQLGMLDPISAAQLMGKATPNDAYAAARTYTKQAAIAAEQQAQQMQQQQEAELVAADAQQIEAEGAELAKQQADYDLKNRQADIKETAPYRQAESEWDKPGALKELLGDPSNSPGVPA